MFERNEGSETARIRTSDLKVGEQEAEAHDRGVDQALTSPGLVLQTKVRKDPYATRVHASRSEVRDNISTRPSSRPNDISANNPRSSSLVSLGLRTCPAPRALLPTLLSRRLVSSAFGLFSHRFVRLTGRS